MSRMIVLAAVLLGACSSASTWDPMAATPRPIEALQVADAADAHAVYQAGVDILSRNPAAAADAFYWAARLDPTWADPLYARRLALLMAQPQLFQLYLEGNRQLHRSPGVASVDSLYLRAYMLNPFLQPKLDIIAYRRVVASSIERQLRLDGVTSVSSMELENYIDQSLRAGSPSVRAWMAFSEGRYDDAVRNYRSALGRDDEPYLRAGLARALFHSGQHAQSRTEFANALDGLRRQDEDRVVRVYESKATYEHAIGLAAEALGDAQAAREAYARALQEDLSYHPAHVQLGVLALSLGDTATALSELALAAEIAPNDVRTRYEYGRTLTRTAQYTDAERELRTAIELEPLFAPAYAALGDALAGAGREAEARAAYADFLTRASRSTPLRADVEARVRALGGGAAR